MGLVARLAAAKQSKRHTQRISCLPRPHGVKIQRSDTELADNATAAYIALGLNNIGETHTSSVTKTHVWNHGIPLRSRTRLEYHVCSLDR